MAMQHIAIGVFVGCIIFYVIIYLLRVIMGPGDDFMAKFGKNWAWNIFQPEAVDLEVCKKAGVMTEANCEDIVTCPTCPTFNAATDCPAAGYIRPTGTQLTTGFFGYDSETDGNDEITYLSIFNANASTRLLNLSPAASGLYEAVLFGGSAEVLKGTKIPLGTPLNTCAEVKTYLESVMNVTLTNQQVADLTKVCQLNTGGTDLEPVPGTLPLTVTNTSTVGDTTDPNTGAIIDGLLLNDLKIFKNAT